MSPKVKRILARITLGLDVFLFLLFFTMLFDPDLFGISLVTLIFLAVDGYLTADYIKEMKYKEKQMEALKQDNEYLRYTKEQLAQAALEAKRKEVSLDEMDQEELIELLTRKQQEYAEKTGEKRI